MPLLNLSISKNKGGLRGSGAVTDRPKYCKTKALSDHKRPWESSDGEHARLNAGVFNTIVNLGDFSAFHETRSMAAPAISALACHQKNRNQLADAGALEVLDDLSFV